MADQTKNKPEDKPEAKKNETPKSKEPKGESDPLKLEKDILEQKAKITNMEPKLKLYKDNSVDLTDKFNKNRKKINIMIKRLDFHHHVFDFYNPGEDNQRAISGGGGAREWRAGPDNANTYPTHDAYEYPVDLMINASKINYEHFLLKDTRLSFISNFIKALPLGQLFRGNIIGALRATWDGDRGQQVSIATTVIAAVTVFAIIPLFVTSWVATSVMIIIILIFSVTGMLNKLETQVNIPMGQAFAGGTDPAQLHPSGALPAGPTDNTENQIKISKQVIGKGPSLYSYLFNMISERILKDAAKREVLDFIRGVNIGQVDNDDHLALQAGTRFSPKKFAGGGAASVLLFAASFLLMFFILGSGVGPAAMVALKGNLLINNLFFPIYSAISSSGQMELPILDTYRLPSVKGPTKGARIKVNVKDVKNSLKKVNLTKNVGLENETVTEINKKLVIRSFAKKKEGLLNRLLNKISAKGITLSEKAMSPLLVELITIGNVGGARARADGAPADDWAGGVIYAGNYDTFINTVKGDFDSSDVDKIETKLGTLEDISRRWTTSKVRIKAERDAAERARAVAGRAPVAHPWGGFATREKIAQIDKDLSALDSSSNSTLTSHYETLKEIYDKDIEKAKQQQESAYEDTELLISGESGKAAAAMDKLLKKYILSIGIIVYDAQNIPAPVAEYHDITGRDGHPDQRGGEWETRDWMGSGDVEPHEKTQAWIVDCYFRTIGDGKAHASQLALQYSRASYELPEVQHILLKSKLMYYLDEYEKQQGLILAEEHKLKLLEKMQKAVKSKGLSLNDRITALKNDIKGESKIVIKILKRNGLGEKVGAIKAAYGITVGAFLNLAENLTMCTDIGKKYNFSTLEIKAFEASVKEIKVYYENQIKEKETEEEKKKAEKTTKEEKEKAEKTVKEERKKAEKLAKEEKEKEKLKEKLKKEIEETPQKEEEKQKKLETIEKIEQIDKEQKQEDKQEDTESEIKIKELTNKTERDTLEIKNLTNETELTTKSINEVVKELQKSRIGSIEFTEHARELLIDQLGRLKKKREIQEKKLSEVVYEKERVAQLLTEMINEEQLILKEKLQLEREKKQFREQQQKFLLDKAKMENTIRQLQTRESNQNKRSLRNNFEQVFTPQLEESKPPISYSTKTTDKGRIRTPQKKVKKPKQFTRNKPRREKKESFIESLTPDFLKTQ
jgi:hypothetical protein